MRFAAYTAASAAAALGVVANAFTQRANFYSATVHLSQTSSHVMILLNFCFVAFIILLHMLQLVLFGRLRTSEVEQLYDKSWYAVTETLLAMSIFRDDFDVKFLLLFAALLGAKCFHWINASRIDYMEQTPPASPLLFHIRTALSFVILFGADAFMIYNSILAVLAVVPMGRPNIMVMFAFEFTILFISCLSTFGKYVLSLTEKRILSIEAARRKAERERERADRKRAREAAGEEEEEEEVEDDEEEWELGGWEERAKWSFCMDLATDLLKLISYFIFFAVVVRSFGVPLHILRDVYVTVRSFVSKVRDFIRYRRATAQMNIRYPDATPAELERDDVCIICREQIKIPVAPPAVDGQPAPPPPPVNQRARAKKLPCGHIFHFACLRGWLERQSRCPTCRRPLLDETPEAAGQAGANAVPGAAPGQPGAQPGQQNRRNFQFGGQFAGIRFEFGQGPDVVQRLLQQQGLAGGVPPVPGVPVPEAGQAAAQPAGTPAPATPAVQIPAAAGDGTPGPAPTTIINRTTFTTSDNQSPILASLAEAQRQLQIATEQLQLALLTLHPPAPPTTDPSTIPTGEFRPGPSYTSDGSSTPRAIPGVPNDLRLPEGWTLIPLNPLPSAVSESDTTLAEAGENVRKRSPEEKEKAEAEPEDTPSTSRNPLFAPTPSSSALFRPGIPTTSSPLFSQSAAQASRTSSGGGLNLGDLVPFLNSAPESTRNALLDSLPHSTALELRAILRATTPQPTTSTPTPPTTSARTTLLTSTLSDLRALHSALTGTPSYTHGHLQPFTAVYLTTQGPYSRGALYGGNEGFERHEEVILKAIRGDSDAKETLVSEWGVGVSEVEEKVGGLEREVKGERGVEWVG